MPSGSSRGIPPTTFVLKPQHADVPSAQLLFKMEAQGGMALLPNNYVLQHLSREAETFITRWPFLASWRLIQIYASMLLPSKRGCVALLTLKIGLVWRRLMWRPYCAGSNPSLPSQQISQWRTSRNRPGVDQACAHTYTPELQLGENKCLHSRHTPDELPSHLFAQRRPNAARQELL